MSLTGSPSGCHCVVVGESEGGRINGLYRRRCILFSSVIRYCHRCRFIVLVRITVIGVAHQQSHNCACGPTRSETDEQHTKPEGGAGNSSKITKSPEIFNSNKTSSFIPRRISLNTEMGQFHRHTHPVFFLPLAITPPPPLASHPRNSWWARLYPDFYTCRCCLLGFIKSRHKFGDYGWRILKCIPFVGGQTQYNHPPITIIL